MFLKKALFLLVGILTLSVWAETDTFSVPIWHADAKWEVHRLGGSNGGGHLQGKISEMGWHALGVPSADLAGAPGPGAINAIGARYYFSWFDFEKGRAHTIGGSGRGHLDGPFSRARLGGWGYGFKPTAAASLDGRYTYITDKWAGRMMLRVLDFKEQEVRTLNHDIYNGGYAGQNPGLTVGDNGKLYMLTSKTAKIGTLFKTICSLTVMDSVGTVEQKMVLDTSNGKFGGIGRLLPIAYDDVNNRLYCGQSNSDWYVFYWDLSDGSLHGVVPKSDSTRGKNSPGSFEGTLFYNEGAVLSFGPDDPTKRFLYMGHIDTWQLHRLDLEKKWVAALLQKGTIGKDSLVTIEFSDTTKSNRVMTYGTMRWVGNGHDFTSATHSPVENFLYKRVN